MALLDRLNSTGPVGSLLGLLALLFLLAIPVPQSATGQSRPRATTSGPVVTVQLDNGDRLIPESLSNLLSRKIRYIESGRAVAADVADIAYDMEQALRQDGYASAMVEYNMYRLGDDGARERVRTAREWPSVQRVEFTVHPGNLTYFGIFRFDGVHHFGDAEIREQIPLASDARKMAPVIFEEARLRAALRRLENMYRFAGYADARVGPATRKSRNEQDAVFIDIVVPVQEGLQYTITEVTVSASDLPQDVFSQVTDGFGLEGKPYFPRQAVVGETEIRRILGISGYRPNITNKIDRAASGDVTIHYTVQAGSPRVFRDVSFISDSDLRTRTVFLERLLPLKPGEPVDAAALDEFEDRLYGMGVFSFVNIGEVPDDDVSIDEVLVGPGSSVPTDLNVTLREGRSRYMELAVGWGSYELLRGRVNYTDNNVFGRALSWSTTGAVSFRTREFSSSLTDQTIFGPKVRLTSYGAYSYRDEPSYDRTRGESGLIGVYRISPLFRTDLSYQFSYTVVEGVTAEIVGAEKGRLATGRIGYGVTFDSRDNVLNPKRGQRVTAHGQWSSRFIGSDIDFAGVDAEATTHHRLREGTILSLNGEYRTRIPLEDRETLPIQERLFLGGDRSVRSFTQDQLGPRAKNGDPLGGLSSLLGSVELRQRIVGELYIAGFYDIGTVSTQALHVDRNYTGMALGFGLRYHLPIGPIRLDGAYNPVFDPQESPEDRPWAVHFAVGFSF